MSIVSSTFQPSGKNPCVSHECSSQGLWSLDEPSLFGKNHLEKHTTCNLANLAESFIKITCPYKSLRKVIRHPFIKMTCVGTSENCMKFSFVSLLALVISTPSGFKVSFEIELSMSCVPLAHWHRPLPKPVGDNPKVELHISTVV